MALEMRGCGGRGGNKWMGKELRFRQGVGCGVDGLM